MQLIQKCNVESMFEIDVPVGLSLLFLAVGAISGTICPNEYLKNTRVKLSGVVVPSIF